MPKSSSQQKSKRTKKIAGPLKRSTIGIEVELFILDKNGNIANKADLLLKKLDEKKRNQNSEIIKEVGQNFIEVGSYPSKDSFSTLQALLDNLKLLLYTAEEENLCLLPLATYPGKFTPELRTDKSYKALANFYGKKRFNITGRTVGFHCHYELPWGVFDRKKLFLKKLFNSKNKQSLINSYNFLIAADPALTCFSQSSPFYQGEYLGKDGRAMLWRGGKDVNYPEGLFANEPLLGQLPKYQQTGTNIIDRIQERYEYWMDGLKKSGYSKRNMPNYRSMLDPNWAPVKINSHGTLEQRGMDMNHILIILSLSKIIQSVLQSIQQDFIKVFSTDRAIRHPFKYENKSIMIPPDSYLRTELQKLSVTKGMQSKKVHDYCSSLLELAKKLSGNKSTEHFEPLEKMLKDKKTVSDEIIATAIKLGHKDLEKPMPKEIAQEIALEHSKRLYQEIVLAEKYIS